VELIACSQRRRSPDHLCQGKPYRSTLIHIAACLFIFSTGGSGRIDTGPVVASRYPQFVPTCAFRKRPTTFDIGFRVGRGHTGRDMQRIQTYALAVVVHAQPDHRWCYLPLLFAYICSEDNGLQLPGDAAELYDPRC